MKITEKYKGLVHLFYKKEDENREKLVDYLKQLGPQKRKDMIDYLDEHIDKIMGEVEKLTERADEFQLLLEPLLMFEDMESVK